MRQAAAVQFSGLETVLLRAREDSVEFPYLLANHVPMVLIALDRLGASAERLEQWYEQYRESHALPLMPPPVAPIIRAAWAEALGDRTREADYRAFFIAETRRLGIDAVIRTYLPAMVNGLAGSATHPLMRLAYAVLKRDDQEVGTALGYWAACYLPLPFATGAVPDTDDPGSVLADVGNIEGIRDYEPETDLLWHNIRAVAALPGFRPVIDRLAFNADTPRRMAATSLALFAGTMDFSALHSVTGMHWLRLVSPHLENAEPFYRAFWQVIASLVPKIGFPALPTAGALEEMRRRQAPAWAEIKRAAVSSDDEHDVSLVFSALQEEEVWKDPLYRVVAARRVGLIA
ncbi:questin oxidase family protein [Rhizobium leguminosarum]|uniref:questin oxidase family protein n=1 Tax=Rhizobium leguminosarum TaxID=384 RepID=UPI001C939C47|nr:questin oxidase family protein [Rhizobium leguminosarum]MBY5708002.1 questin oxidase family protein [Rhizobium leguminosarum]